MGRSIGARFRRRIRDDPVRSRRPRATIHGEAAVLLSS